MPDLSEKYFPVIEKFQTAKAAGKTVEEYCRQQSINTKTFYYWKKKYLARGTKGFVPLSVVEQVSRKVITIQYSDGTRLVFEDTAKPLFIRKLLPAFNP
jgi:hypothetical protein